MTIMYNDIVAVQQLDKKCVLKYYAQIKSETKVFVHKWYGITLTLPRF